MPKTPPDEDKRAECKKRRPRGKLVTAHVPGHLSPIRIRIEGFIKKLRPEIKGTCTISCTIIFPESFPASFLISREQIVFYLLEANIQLVIVGVVEGLS